ncbi:MAG: AgmX/PglI C-terminal domain-containing protein [Polyangia bacterium]
MRLSIATLTRPLSYILPLGLSLGLAACGGPAQDDGAKSKLATDLVQCRNDLSELKGQLALAKAELAKALASQTTKIDAVDVNPAHPKVSGSKEGNVSPEAVAKVVKLNATGFRACYDRALKRKPDLQYVSSVNAHFSVRNTGTAQNIGFAPHTDSEMEGCMSQLMQKWKFPTFQGDPVAFEVPVNLVAR